MIDHQEAAPPKYIDFYVLGGDGIFIMRTAAPAFVAQFVGSYDIEVLAFRGGEDLLAMGWCYYTCEAFDELLALNARWPKDQPSPP